MLKIALLYQCLGQSRTCGIEFSIVNAETCLRQAGSSCYSSFIAKQLLDTITDTDSVLFFSALPKYIEWMNKKVSNKKVHKYSI